MQKQVRDDQELDTSRHAVEGSALQEEGSDDRGAAARRASSGSLPGSVRSSMEGSFGTDFSGVRVHEGAELDGARALTRGDDVQFAPGEYDPESRDGRELIGHELTHVVQQRQGQVGAAEKRDGAAATDAEVEADRAGEAAADGRPAQVHGAVGDVAQAKTDDELGDKEAAKVVDLAFQDAAERGYKAIKSLEQFEGSDETRGSMFGDLVMGVHRAIDHACEVFIDDEKLKKTVHRSATQAATNMIILISMGPDEASRTGFDSDLECMERHLAGWKRPSKVSGPKKADLDAAESEQVVRLDLEGARASILSSLDLHVLGKEEKDDDIWGTGGASFLEHAIEVLGSKDMKSKVKSLKGDVERTRDIALRIMDYAPKGTWSLRLRANINSLAELVGIPKLPDAGGPTVAKPQPRPASPKDTGDMLPSEGTATIGELERFRTLRSKAADKFESMIEMRGAAVDEIDLEIDSKDPKPKSFWESLVKGLAMAALSAVTGGVGAAIASRIAGSIASGVLKDGVTEAITVLVGDGLLAAQTAAMEGGTPGSPSTGTDGTAGGGWSSKDSKAAFFGLQKRALSFEKGSQKDAFMDASEPLAVEAHVAPGAAIAAIQTTADALALEVQNASALQRKHTAAKWAIYNVQSQMGGKVEDSLDPDRQLMHETGYNGTDMTDATAGREGTNKGIPTKVDLGVDNVNGMIDIRVENKHDDDTMKIKSARMAGMNSKIRERIAAMDLKEVGVPIRLHGDMHGKKGGHQYMVLTRNEEGSILINASEKAKEFLAEHGKTYQDGAQNLFDWLIEKPLKDRGIKLDD